MTGRAGAMPDLAMGDPIGIPSDAPPQTDLVAESPQFQSAPDLEVIESQDASAKLPVYGLDEIAQQITDEYWINTGRAPRSFDLAPGEAITVDLTAISEAGQTLARWALDAWAEVSGLRFEETDKNAQITFTDDEPNAFVESKVSGEEIRSAQVNVSAFWLESFGDTADSYTFHTYLHEIGHALGLGHSGDYNGAAHYPDDASYANDSWQVSIMSYFDQAENDFVDGSYAFVVTPQAADIVAIQALYGTAEAETQNTVWGAEGTSTGHLDDLLEQALGTEKAEPGVFEGETPFAFTLYDTGGQDLLDLSPWSGGQVVNLAEGGISDVLGAEGNMVIARDTVIEDAATGAGNDKIFGNDVGNALAGGAGNDRLVGYGGRDQLQGGDGDDVLAGRNGVDTLTGGRGADVLRGGAGNDIMQGGGDDDFLRGGQNDDQLTGGAGRDVFSFALGNSGSDVITDYEAGLDQLEIDLKGADPSAVAVSIEAGNTVLRFGGDVLTLEGVRLTESEIGLDFA